MYEKVLDAEGRICLVLLVSSFLTMDRLYELVGSDIDER